MRAVSAYFAILAVFSGNVFAEAIPISSLFNTSRTLEDKKAIPRTEKIPFGNGTLFNGACLFSGSLDTLKASLLDRGELEISFDNLSEPPRLLTVSFSSETCDDHFEKTFHPFHWRGNKLSFPLSKIRSKGVFLSHWSNVTKIELTLDDLSLVGAASPFQTNLSSSAEYPAPSFSGDNWKRLMARASKGNIRSLEIEACHIITTSEDLDLSELAQHLDDVWSYYQSSYPYLTSETPHAKPAFLIAADESEYKVLLGQTASEFAIRTSAGISSGYAVCGAAFSYYSPEHGSVRPVYTHEFVHSLLENYGSIPSDNGWLHEGIATLAQIEFHDSGMSEILRERRCRSAGRLGLLPANQLMDGHRINSNHYWQAALAVEALRSTSSPGSSNCRLASAISRFSNSGSRSYCLDMAGGETWVSIERTLIDQVYSYSVPEKPAFAKKLMLAKAK